MDGVPVRWNDSPNPEDLAEENKSCGEIKPMTKSEFERKFLLTNDANNSIIDSGGGEMDENISGAISGALDPESKDAEKHAEKYYASVRNMKNDYINIAKNTGFSENDIKEIKNYLFMEKHELTDGYKRFEPYYEIAQSWQRLEIGKNIKEQDIILLNHELTELKLVKSGMSQDKAHIEASKKFNYRKAIEKED